MGAHCIDTYAKFTALISSMALNPSLCPDAIERFTNEARDAHTYLFWRDTLTGFVVQAAMLLYGQDRVRANIKYCAGADLNIGSIVDIALGRSSWSGAIIHADEFTANEYYNDWMRPQGYCRRRGGAILYYYVGRVIFVDVDLPGQRADDLERGWRELLTTLILPCQHPLEINRALNGLRIERFMTSNGQTIGAAMVVPGEDDRPVFAIGASWRPLSDGAPVRPDVSGRNSLPEAVRALPDIGSVIRIGPRWKRWRRHGLNTGSRLHGFSRYGALSAIDHRTRHMAPPKSGASTQDAVARLLALAASERDVATALSVGKTAPGYQKNGGRASKPYAIRSRSQCRRWTSAGRWTGLVGQTSPERGEGGRYPSWSLSIVTGS